MTTIELCGLKVAGAHGVKKDERERERTFLYDLRLDLRDDPDADRIEETVDYREVARCVREVSDSRHFHILEALAAAVADAVLAGFPVEAVRVRVRKTAIRPAGLPVEFAAAIVERRVARSRRPLH
jgi:dihydroneopterin aldolase